MADFERIKQEISGHSVTITSWYDDSTEMWQASAPAYSHLFSHPSARPIGSPTRKSAIERTINILTKHFNSPVH